MVLKRQEALQAKQRAVYSKLRISTGPIDQTPKHTSSAETIDLADKKDYRIRNITR
jgi:hypothetical protein